MIEVTLFFLKLILIIREHFIMKIKKYCSIHTLIALCYFGLYLVIGLSLLVRQPFGSPPDEYNRYLIPQYIAQNGTLPNGYEESIRIKGYGFSYAFQPILPYMLQGYAMRLTGLFTDSSDALLYTARTVNLILGFLTAWTVLLLSKKWFQDRRFGWIFAFLATFLPQSIFVHTYVNTDSCCMFGIVVILYGLTRGLKDRFSGSSCLILSAGIILCALSYYNAYGYILSCILIFTAFFLSRSGRKICFDLKSFLKKGTLISALVLAGIGWWFIRSALLYEGDFLGLRARSQCASLYAMPEYHPDTRITWQSQGYSLWDMLTKSDFLTLSTLSFIGIYGPMTIITSIWVYRFYRTLFFTGVTLSVLLWVKNTVFGAPAHSADYGSAKTMSRTEKPFFYLTVFYHINMIFCIIMPLILSMFYSYSTDYQPQGRYLLPSLLPLCLYTVKGLEKTGRLPAFSKIRKSRLLTCFSVLLCTVIAGMLLLTVYGYVLPYYRANPHV